MWSPGLQQNHIQYTVQVHYVQYIQVLPIFDVRVCMYLCMYTNAIQQDNSPIITTDCWQLADLSFRRGRGN